MFILSSSTELSAVPTAVPDRTPTHAVALLAGVLAALAVAVVRAGPIVVLVGSDVSFEAVQLIWIEVCESGAPVGAPGTVGGVPSGAGVVMVADAGKELGAPAKVVGFVRLALGEGVEKKVDDFAAEVAAMTS